MDVPAERAAIVSAFRAEPGEGGEVRFLRGAVIVAAPDFQDGQRVTLADLESVVHYDGAFMTAQESVRLAHRYLEKRPSFDLEHDGRARAATAIESHIVREQDGILTPGSFVLAAKSYDAGINALIDAGELRAWSVQFMVSVTPVTVILAQPGMADVPLMLMRFDNGDPQFVSFVKFPAIGVDWAEVEKSAPVMSANLSMAWDEDAAQARVAEWATVDSPYGKALHMGRYSRAFASVGRSGFNQQFADVVDGQLVAVPRAIQQIARDGLDLGSVPVARIGRLLGLTGHKATERSMAAQWEGFLGNLGITEASLSEARAAKAEPKATEVDLSAEAEAAAAASTEVVDASLAADLDEAAAAIDEAARAVDEAEAALAADNAATTDEKNLADADGETEDQALAADDGALDTDAAVAAAERAAEVLKETLAAADDAVADPTFDALRAMLPGLTDETLRGMAATAELADDGTVTLRATPVKREWVDRAMTFDEAFGRLAPGWAFDAGLSAAAWSMDDTMWSILWDGDVDRDAKIVLMRAAVTDYAVAMNGVIDLYDSMTQVEVRALAESMSNRGDVVERAVIAPDPSVELAAFKARAETAEAAAATAQTQVETERASVAALTTENAALLSAAPAPAAPSGDGPETNQSGAKRGVAWGPVLGI